MASRRSRQQDDENLPAVADFSGAVGTFGDSLPEAWQDKLSQSAKEQKATQSGDGGWQWFSIRGGVVKFDGEVRESTFPAIILGAAFDYRYYENAFDPENPESPTCFASGIRADGSLVEVADMAPAEDLDTKYSESCTSCPMNAFGTARQGKGKGCSQRIRIALLSAYDDLHPDTLQGDGARMLIPVTSIGGRVPADHGLPGIWKNWNSYIAALNDLGLPTWAVVTNIHVMPDPNVQVKVLFQPLGPITREDALEILEKRSKDAVTHLAQAPATNGGDDKDGDKPQKKTRTVRRKASQKKAPTSAAPKANAGGGDEDDAKPKRSTRKF